MAFAEVGSPLAVVVRQHILARLDECGGNRTRTAKALGISVRGLRDKLHEYASQGISIPQRGVGKSPASCRQDLVWSTGD